MTDGPWTITALKEYLDARFAETARAIDKAEGALEARLEGMNEFRAQILSERGRFVTIDVYEQKHAQLDQELDEVRRSYVTQDKHDGLRESTETNFRSVEKFQSRVIGALLLLSVVMPLLTTGLVYALTMR